MHIRPTAQKIFRVLSRTIARLPGGAHECAICTNRVRRFLPYRDGLRSMPPVIRSLRIVGSDIENFECPRCGSHDRERHLLLYLRAANLLPRMKGAHILHFAPERHLQEFIRGAQPGEYVLADLFPQDARVQRIDLENIPFPAAHFDFVVANHVLEHVSDDGQALREIFRVLKGGGHAILQTPYAAGLARTFEDPCIDSEMARLHAYGQEDHLRLYGQDFVERVEASGLRSAVASHETLLPSVDARRAGVNAAEALLLFRKPDES
jgi:SAM-dependent methyltransferase